MERFDYRVYWSGPMDHYEGYVHVSDISLHFENLIKRVPRLDMTFFQLWHKTLHKLYWAWTKCKGIDLDLRSPDFYIRVIVEEEHVVQIYVVFKADNNGTMYAIVDDHFDHNDMVKNTLYHEFDSEWELHKND